MATTMLSADIPIVSARLSHARTSTTLNVYAHAVPGGDGLAAEVLSSILSDALMHTDNRRPAARFMPASEQGGVRGRDPRIVLELPYLRLCKLMQHDRQFRLTTTTRD